MEKKHYKLLKDFEDPNGTIRAGTIKDAHQWMARFALLNESELDSKSDWFQEVYPYYASATDSIQNRKLDEILSILKRKENVLGHTPMELAQSFALFCWGKTITTELKTIEALFLRWIDECGILNEQKQS